ncbi:hypothetical protein H9P43_003774 [Blastocladiella emersonii ATCC 22665]|nr:hypothetical protein H9P43_003774 [Blastocladiella emersonii ATCC 22665]
MSAPRDPGRGPPPAAARQPRPCTAPAASAIHRALVVGGMLLGLLLLASTAAAQTATIRYYVSPTGSDTNDCLASTTGRVCKTLQRALNLAPTTGAEIIMAPGNYSGPGNVGLTFPGKTVNITAPGGSGSTFIDGQRTSQIFRLVAGEAGWVDGLTITRGQSISGGCALYKQSTLSFRNSVFEACQALNQGTASNNTETFAEGGGALYILQAAPKFVNVTFQYNWANQAASSAWLDNGGDAEFTDCKFLYERAESFGGSIVPEGTSYPKFTNCLWNGCFSKFGGSIDTGSTSRAEFWGVTVANSTGQRGGAVYHYNMDNVKFYNSRFINNTAETNGGAVVFSLSVNSTYVNCTFENNVAGGVGGAVYAEASSTPRFFSTTFLHNTAPGGGGGYFSRGNTKTAFNDCAFVNNTAIYGGALLFEDSSIVNINNMTCTGNSVNLDGGCVKFQNSVNLTATNSYIARNSATTEGGGIQVDSSSVITSTNNVIENNKAGTIGGGVYLTSTAQGTFTNTVIRSNSAAKGGGFGLGSRASATFNGVKLTSNTAGLGGGMYTSSSQGFTATAASNMSFNTAQFGGAIFFDSNSNQNTITGGTVSGNSAKAGAAFFYNVWDRLLNYTGTSFTGNTALYGPIEATKPWRMVNINDLRPGYSPKDRFSISLKLVDYFQNVAVDTPDQVIVTIEGQGGLQVDSSIPRQGFQDGLAIFDSVIVAGTLNNVYTLSAVSNSLPTLNFTIQVLSCGPGYQKTSLASDPVYRCTQCQPGTYSLVADSQCYPCPTGADCTSGGANITALEGFWMDPRSLADLNPKLYRCKSGNCLEKSQCAANRYGRLCSTCEDGYSEWNSKCQDCTLTSPGWMMAPLMSGIMYAAFLVRYPRLTEAGIPKSLVFFIQSAIILVANDKRVSAQSFLQTFNVAFDWIINLDYRSRCVLNLSALPRLAYDFFAPSTPIIGVVLCYIVMRLYHAIFLHAPMTSYWNWRVIAAFVWVLLWGYIMVAKATFNLLNCIQIGDAHVLAAAPGIVCGSPEHVPYQAFAWVVVIFYILGLPALCAGLLVYSRKRLMADPNYPLVKELYRSFQPSLWYFEIVLTLRKLLLTLLDVFLAPFEAEHALALAVFFYAIFIVQYATQPFKNRLFNRAEDFLLMTLILMAGLSMGDTMRTNYLSTMDILGASYGFVVIGIVVVLTFIVMLTNTGSRVVAKFVQSHPVIARSINNIAAAKERVAAMGSTYSMHASPKGSIGALSSKSGKHGGGGTTSPKGGASTPTKKASMSQELHATSGHLKSAMKNSPSMQGVVKSSALAEARDSREAPPSPTEKPTIMVTPTTVARPPRSEGEEEAGR